MVFGCAWCAQLISIVLVSLFVLCRHLSEDGLKKLAGGEDGQPMVTDVRELAKRALDVSADNIEMAYVGSFFLINALGRGQIDLREISKGGGLASEYMKSSKLEVSGAGVIVQVMGVRNVSAPKANEESKTSPRMLQLDLTDGQNVCLALEMENIQVRYCACVSR